MPDKISERSPETANERLKALRQVFLVAVNNDPAERYPAPFNPDPFRAQPKGKPRKGTS